MAIMNKGKAAKVTFAGFMVALIAYAAWKWPHWRASSEAGSAYVARITCSCRYVEGRSAESCAQDVKEYARLVVVREKTGERVVTASVPLLGDAEARFTPGYGCLMQP